jgi:hypothetical protein
MAHALTWIDRLRIERAVWALDQRLYDLPRKPRIARRHELRENLRTAAADVGAVAALRNLGVSRQLAAEYLSAQFGQGARPSWYAAAAFLLTTQLVLTPLLSEATSAFGDAITAADPDATGTFTWAGIAYLQSSVTYTFVDVVPLKRVDVPVDENLLRVGQLGGVRRSRPGRPRALATETRSHPLGAEGPDHELSDDLGAHGLLPAEALRVLSVTVPPGARRDERRATPEAGPNRPRG